METEVSGAVARTNEVATLDPGSLGPIGRVLTLAGL